MPDAPAIDDRAVLRARLIAMRAELVEQMARDRIEGGTLALLARINVAIEAIEAAGEAPADGATIRLALYSEAEAVAAVMLAPRRAIALASRLIAAALRRLPA